MLFFPEVPRRCAGRAGQTGTMPAAHDAQLSAIAAAIDDLAARSAALADAVEGEGASEASSALFEVERSLQMAGRSVDRARRSLGA